MPPQSRKSADRAVKEFLKGVMKMKRTTLLKTVFSFLMIGAGWVLFPGNSKAVDTYVGDTEIYGSTSATSSSTAPNVLFLVDDSGSMNDAPPSSPAPYDPNTTYAPQNICIGALEKDPNSAFASLSSGGRILLERPPVIASANRGNYGEEAKSNKGKWRDGVKATVSAVKAGWTGGVTAAANLIWDGKMPEFVRVATHTVSGTVSGMGSKTVSLSLTGTDTNGNPVALNTTTNPAGDYSFTVPTRGNYTVTPTLSGYTFASVLPLTPASAPVVCTGGGNTCNGSPGVPQSDPANVDFTATPVGATYYIQGWITSGPALPGVTVKVTDGSGNVWTVVTDNFGKYNVSGLPNGTYTVTPGPYTGYTFSPANQSVTISGGNQTNINFTGVSAGTNFSISGNIQHSSNGRNFKNVTITVTTSLGANFATTTTDRFGNYTIVGLASGSTYTVTATFTGYTFAYAYFPNGVNTTVSGASTTVDFIGTANAAPGTYSISGSVVDSTGNKLQGVTITIYDNTNAVVGTATTGSNGSYSLSGFSNGTYTATPTLTGYTFSPASQSVPVNNSDVNGVNFTGTLGGGPILGCGAQTIYKFTSGNPDTYNNWGNMSDGVYTNCAAAYTALTTTGVWIGNLNSGNGSCTASDQSGAFFIGNYLNFTVNINPTPSGTAKITIAIQTVQKLIKSNSGLNMGLMTFDNGSHGGTFMQLSNGYVSYVQPALSGSYGSTNNQANLITAVGALNASTSTPLGGALYDAMLYFMGKKPYTTSSSKWNSPSVNYTPPGTYPSPITSGCQANYVIVVTDGMSTNDQAVGAPFAATSGCPNGDCDGGGSDNELQILGVSSGSGSDYMDDVAYYMHNHDMQPVTYPGSRVTVFTVGFALDPAVTDDLQGITLLTETAANGGGKFVNVTNAATLMTTLTNILGSILQVNTSFVAPVVPVSPANRTYSGNSIYVGLFLPEPSGFWYGNVKKFGFVNGQVVDVNGNVATSTTGAFNSTAESIWNPTQIQDGGVVSEGGVGGVLIKQTPQNRNLFTYMGVTGNLTSSSNTFTTGNTLLTPSKLGFAATDAVDLTATVNYVWGYNTAGNSARTWIMGDVLHSEPAVVNYASNLSVVYVGGNDGMLHAFADINPLNYNCAITTFGGGGTLTNKVNPANACPTSPAFTAPTMTQPLGSANTVNIMDGQELWGFIPPDILPNLQNLTGSVHGYGVDGSPAMYYYDANGDGKIGTTSSDCKPAGSTNCDQVLLVFGERRGGQGYWALDVTNPLNPKVVWNISNNTAGFSELGETFSQPQIAPVNTGGSSAQQIAILAAGYDNATEDLNITPSYATTVGYQNTMNKSGRGIYAVDLQTGNYVWSWVYSSTRATTANGTSNNPVYSIASDVTVLDSNNNGTVDTIYVGDVGGQMWKFDVSSSTVSNWSGKVIFQSNPGNDGSKGRKFFYAPDVTYEAGYQALFFGSGDREHPYINTTGSVVPVDRLYSSYDNINYTKFVTEGPTTSVSSNSAPQLMDVTTNNAPTVGGAGWYIRLDTATTSHLAGEKMLAPPLVLNKVVTYTTYAPLLITQSGTCGAALGTGFVWSLNYATGASYFDYNKSGGALTLSDRFNSIGGGIPSGVVVTVSPSGMTGLVGVGGGIGTVPLATGAQFNQLFWHQPY
jgi:type IV pilus assembly protein PilY1